jgi:hypothetical protein
MKRSARQAVEECDEEKSAHALVFDPGPFPDGRKGLDISDHSPRYIKKTHRAAGSLRLA